MTVRIVLNGAGLGSLLESQGVEAALLEKAQQVAQAARSRAPKLSNGQDLPITVTPGHPGRTRVRAFVAIDHPSGEAVESTHRVLGGSLDAAR